MANTILSINARIEITGGADRFFTEINKLMVEKGETVVSFTCEPDKAINSDSQNYRHYFFTRNLIFGKIFQKIITLITIFYAPSILRDLEKVIIREKPAIAHIHNIYHRIPYQILSLLKKHNIKVLWWLHDHKWICPNHQLFTKDKVCMRCKNGSYLNAVFFRCQNNSLFQSAVAACFAYFVRWNNFARYVDLFISPSQSSYDIFKAFSFPLAKIKLLHHFNYDTQYANSTINKTELLPSSYALYVGRLERNKGVFSLIWTFGKAHLPLVVIGTGNSERELKKICTDNLFTTIVFKGYTPPENLDIYYRNCLFTIVPSIWYEIFGLAILESFNYAKPVIGSSIGAIPEIIEEGKTGFLYNPGDINTLGEKSRHLFADQELAEKMGVEGQRVVKQMFSREHYWNDLNKIHSDILIS